MKQHTVINKNICTVLVLFLVCSFARTALGESTPGPADNGTFTPTPIATQVPSPTPTGAIPYQINGDVNTDNKIDIIDALLICQFYVGMHPDNFNANVANVNNDDKINIVDALLVAQYYVGIIPGF